MKLQPHQPSVYPQNPDDSIVLSTGIYDFQHFSDAELQTVRAVLDTSENKYPRKYQGIGLAMEAFSVVYKARYILQDRKSVV